MRFTTRFFFTTILVFCLSIGRSARAETIDKVAQESGEWGFIEWLPKGVPEGKDIVHIEGDFTVNYTGGTSENLSRVYVGDDTRKFSSNDGTLEISSGVLSVNANAAGAFLIGRADGSVGTLNVNGGTMKGIGSTSGSGMQIAFGSKSTGTVTVSAGELLMTNGMTIGYGDQSTGHFTISGGIVSITNNSEGSGPVNVGTRQPEGGTSTATFRQTGGSMSVLARYFGVGYAGGASQIMRASAEITGGTFSANVRVGRQHNVKSGGGDGGTLTIGPAAKISGRDEAWEVSGNGKIIFLLGPDATFNPVDLTAATADHALEFTQDRAHITVDGSKLTYASGLGPITLITFSEGKEPSELSEQNVVFEYMGFDKRFAPDLIWTETGLQLNLH